jgi:Flp pilus assembly pilin Flp
MDTSGTVDRPAGTCRKGLCSAEGATAVEYAIVAALIAMAIVLSVFALGRTTSDSFCGPVPALGGAQGDC